MFKKSGVFLCCLFALSLVIIGCGGGSSGGNPVGPTLTTGTNANLSGTVLFDNAPVPFAAVYLYKSEKAHTFGMAQLPSLKGSLAAQQIISDGAYSTTTDATGAYSFVDIPVGQYTLIALRDENHQFVQTGVLLGQVTTLNPQLTPTGKITGKVTQTIGSVVQNIAGVFVYINGTSYLAVTDTAGNFVISNVPANALTTSAAYEILVSSALGTASPVAGVRVNPGSTTDIGTIALIAPPAANYVNLSGSLVAGGSVSSTELADQFVVLTHHTDGTVFGTHTDAAGNFQFRVMKAGTYIVLCSDSDYNYSPDPLIVNIVNLDNATLTLSAITVDAAQVQNTGSIFGTVTLAGSPVAGAIVHASGTSLVGVSNASGRFVIDKVPANTSATPYTLELSASMGTAPTKTGVVVNIGQATDAGIFAITVPTTGYKTITGQLVAVSPVTTTMLANRLVQLTAPDGKVIAAYSNSTGAFSLMTTQTGAHTLTVIDNSYDYAPRTQNISVATLDNSAQALTAINGSLSNLNISVSGAVAWATPPTGWVISEGEVVLQNQPGTANLLEKRVVAINSPANFRFDNVPPGSYWLSVNPERNGYQSSALSVTVVAGVDQAGLSLSATAIAPVIGATQVMDASTVQLLLGANFVDSTQMQAIVNDRPLNPIDPWNTNAWDATRSFFDISALAPGEYSIQLIKTLGTMKIAGNKSYFVKPVQPPTNITAESTDTSITFSWQNAPFVSEVSVELWLQTTQITPAQKITGNSYTYTNLKPGTEYNIVITSYYSNQTAPPIAQYGFSTKSQGLNFITARALLTAADIPDNDAIFGFEVYNNTAYIGAHGYTTGAPITLYAVNLASNTFVSTSLTNDGLALDALYSLAVNSAGVFVTHKQTDPVLTKLNLDLTSPTSKSLISAAPAGFGLGTVSTASIRSFENRLFLVARFASTFVGINEVNPATLAVVNPAFSVDTAKNFVDSGKSAELAYDSMSNTLYLICAETPGDAIDITRIRAFSGMNLGLTPQIVTELSESRRIFGASSLNKQLYTATYGYSSYFYEGYAIDGSSGYTREMFSITGVDHDKQGRVWICTTGGDYDYFHRLDQGLNVVQTMGMPDYIDPLYSFAQELTRVRLDRQNGMMYMLHIAANNDLAVYSYNSNY